MTNDASSDARNAAADAISSGRPKRPSMCASRYCSRTCCMPSSPMTDSNIGVSMNPGTDAVGAHADAPVVDGEVLREQHDPALRRVVRAAALGALDALDAGDVDEASRLLLDHVRERVLAHEERAGEVDADRRAPIRPRRAGGSDRRRRHRRRSARRRGGRGRAPRRRPASRIDDSSATSAITHVAVGTRLQVEADDLRALVARTGGRTRGRSPTRRRSPARPCRPGDPRRMLTETCSSRQDGGAGP